MDGLWTIIGPVIGAVALVQLALAAVREWSAARRVVSVNGLDADMYADHGCVPTQFAGSRFRVVRAAASVTGFFMVGPKTPKQVFAVCGIVGARDSNLIDYREVRPRDYLGVMLDEGEHPASFDRAMRRGIASLSRTIAIRDLSEPECNGNAHCVTVRARGNLGRATDGSDHQWLEYEVTSAPPRSSGRSGLTPLADLPSDSIELVIVPADAYAQARDDAIQRYDGKLRRRLLRYNPKPRVALAHVVARITIPLAVLIGLAVTLLGWGATAAIVLALVAIPLSLLLIAVTWSVPIAFVMYIRHRIRKLRPRVQPAQHTEPDAPFKTIPLRRADLPPPRAWTGATSHTMSAGRFVNATDARSMLAYAWRQYPW